MMAKSLSTLFGAAVVVFFNSFHSLYERSHVQIVAYISNAMSNEFAFDKCFCGMT